MIDILAMDNPSGRTILVVGATGLLGRTVCAQLRARGHTVRGLARAGSPMTATLRDLGVEISTGDLRSSADVQTACSGVTTVVCTATAMGSKDRGLTLGAIDGEAIPRLIAEAKASGVKHFVFVSASPSLPSSAPLVRYKRQAERAVRASGMEWTILQPTVFMEIWLSEALGWNIREGKATIFGAGTSPMSWVSVDDVAACVVASVDDPSLRNKDVPIGGPEALSPNQVLAIFERVSGRPFAAKRVPRVLLAAMGPVVALFNEGIASGMIMGAATANGDVIDSPLQRALGHEKTSVETYAKRVCGSRVAQS